jgi:SAM-dependent methyltransferase
MLWVVIDETLSGIEAASMRAIHFAPERQLEDILSGLLASYETSSLDGRDTHHAADLRRLPFPDSSYDFVIASHVLEHIQEDRQALGEIRRVLTPGGIAILPVPLVGKTTIEYGEPRPEEAGHVRAPGLDYYQRYNDFFDRVDIRNADDYPKRFHLIPDLTNGTGLGIHRIPVSYA